MSEMKIWPTIHTLLVQFAPRIAEAEAASSYDERIAIINGVSAHIAGKVEEQIAARLRSMEEALKEAHEAINLAVTIAQGRFPATARKAPLEVLADAERKARAALAGAVRTSRKTLSGEGQ